ncbi:MAG: enoyl-CoA hydratase/isomerase family protein [Oscillospiraceae bacterium]|nr:enoyl-CoA hydratase/isomerase family protein [Oscillospiraceae bacterium]
MFEGKYFLFTLDKGIGILTLNRPPYNIFEAGFYTELEEVETHISGQEGIRCLIINANGKCFSAGIDLNYLQNVSSAYVLQKLPGLQRIYGFWQEQNYPVIAAVQGLCTGSGLEFILGADIRIAAEDARFSLPEVQLGLSPDMGGTSRLTRLVGVGQAKRMIIAGEEIPAEEALRIGLVEVVVPLEELNGRAMKMAKTIARSPEAAVRFAKKGVNLTDEGGLRAGQIFEQAQSTYCCGTQDLQNAVAAYKAMISARSKK